MIEALTREGDLVMLAVVACVAVAGLLVERAFLSGRWNTYFLLGFPVVPELVPISELPQGGGETASVRWVVDPEAGVVRFWAQPGSRGAPMGLHGAVTPVRGPGGRVALPVRWAPPWTPFLALLWFGALGVARGQGLLTAPVAVILIVVLALVYRRAAATAAGELRWAFVQAGEGAEDSTGR